MNFGISFICSTDNLFWMISSLSMGWIFAGRLAVLLSSLHTLLGLTHNSCSSSLPEESLLQLLSVSLEVDDSSTRFDFDKILSCSSSVCSSGSFNGIAKRDKTF